MATPGGVADTEVPLLQQLVNGGAAGAGSGVISVGGVPQAYDYVGYTYVSGGAANNDRVQTVTYRSGGASGTVVAVTTYSYYTTTNNISSIRTSAF